MKMRLIASIFFSIVMLFYSDVDAGNSMSTKKSPTLASSIKSGNLQKIEELVKNNILPQDSDICLAAMCNQNEIAQFLLNQGVHPNVGQPRKTPLHYAVQHKNQELVKLLLKHKATVHSYNIDSAVNNENIEILKLLLAASPSIWANSFCEAVKSGKINMVQTFLEHDRAYYAKVKNSQGESSFYLASFHSSLDMIKLLLQNGSQVDAFSLQASINFAKNLYANDAERLKLLTFTQKNSSNWANPLWWALYTQDREKIAQLLAMRATVDANMIDYVIDHEPSQLLESLLPQAVSIYENSLCKAAKNGDVKKVVAFVQQKRIPLNYQDDVGNSALHYATTYGHLDIIKVLLAHCANPNLKNYDKQSSIDLAVQSDQPSIKEFFEHYQQDPIIVQNELKAEFEEKQSYSYGRRRTQSLPIRIPTRVSQDNILTFSQKTI